MSLQEITITSLDHLLTYVDNVKDAQDIIKEFNEFIDSDRRIFKLDLQPRFDTRNLSAKETGQMLAGTLEEIVPLLRVLVYRKPQGDVMHDIIINELCPRCNCEMSNLGNVSGIVILTHPAEWKEVHVCYTCKVKRIKSVFEKLPVLPNLEEFEEV